MCACHLHAALLSAVDDVEFSPSTDTTLEHIYDVQDKKTPFISSYSHIAPQHGKINDLSMNHFSAGNLCTYESVKRCNQL